MYPLGAPWNGLIPLLGDTNGVAFSVQMGPMHCNAAAAKVEVHFIHHLHHLKMTRYGILTYR